MTCLPSVHVFFFKQKTAYEMRMSDWSSDVCSSDLIRVAVERADIVGRVDDRDRAGVRFDARAAHRDLVPFEAAVLHVEDAASGWPGLPVADRSEARGVGEECVSTCRIRGSSYHYTKKQLPNLLSNIM